MNVGSGPQPGRLRVLHILDNLGMGGAETWLMELLRYWSREGANAPQIDFLATGGVPSYYDEEAKALGARIFYLRYSRSQLPSFIRGFRQILRNGRYAAIHDHGDYASGWHFLMGAGVLPPVRVAHVHNPWMHITERYAVSHTRRLTAVVGKWLVNLLATNICGTSEEILRTYGFQPDRSRLPAVSAVHCGIDVNKFNAPRDSDRRSVLDEFSWPEQAKVVLFVGRLDRALKLDDPSNHKNSWFALNVVRAAAEKDPAIRFLMAGEGENPRDEINRNIHQWGLQDELRLIGVRSDIARLMRAADVLLFPSRQEGLGMVAVEAQAAGLPVLASLAVPRESVVLPELFTALSLSEPIGLWADSLVAMLASPRVPMEICRKLVEASAFSIANSSRSLQKIYNGSASRSERSER